jgi:hypothetical protein
MKCCCRGSDYSPSSVDFDEEESEDEDIINLDTLEKIATIFAFSSSMIAFFMKFGSVIRMPDIPWPGWVLSFAHFLSSLITHALSFFPSLPDFDAQTTSILNGIVPFLLFPILWRCFRSSDTFPAVFVWEPAMPVIFVGFIAFAIAAKSFASDNIAEIMFWVMIALVILPSVLWISALPCENAVGPILLGLWCLLWMGNGPSCFGGILRGIPNPCSGMFLFFRNDNPLYHLICVMIDVAIVIIIGLTATGSNAFPFPVSELCSILIVLCIVFAFVHLLVLPIFILRRKQMDCVQIF